MSFPPAFLSVPNSVQKKIRSDVQIAEAVADTAARRAPDVVPVTAFSAGAARMVARVRATNQPLILTHHGRGAAVLLSIAAYESLLEEIELLREVRDTEDAVAAQAMSGQSSVETRLRAISGR
jgi:prevent-host-death family protein